MTAKANQRKSGGAGDRACPTREQIRGLREVAEAVTGAPRLSPGLEALLAPLETLIGSRAIALMLLSKDGHRLRIAASHGLQGEVAEGAERPGWGADQAPAAWRAVAERRALLAVAEDLAPAELSALPAADGARAALYLPLLAEGHTLGLLALYGEEASLAALDPDLLRLAGGLVAIAVANARASEAMEKLDLERTRFMLQVAHNLRAPLNASLSMLEVVSGGYTGGVTPEQRDQLERVGVRLRRLSDMVGELLAINQIRAQGREPEALPVSARALAADVERTFRDAAAAKGLRLRVAAAPDLPDIRGDAGALLQMLENLVSNALKYTPAGGEVTVGFERGAGNGWRIVVADTGIGIPEAEQPRLFSEFFRASNARRLDEIGTGLGLSIVKQAVEWHGGSVRLESREGRGTRVTVELPPGGADFR